MKRGVDEAVSREKGQMIPDVYRQQKVKVRPKERPEGNSQELHPPPPHCPAPPVDRAFHSFLSLQVGPLDLLEPPVISWIMDLPPPSPLEGGQGTSACASLTWKETLSADWKLLQGAPDLASRQQLAGSFREGAGGGGDLQDQPV